MLFVPDEMQSSISAVIALDLESAQIDGQYGLTAVYSREAQACAVSQNRARLSSGVAGPGR